jgi:lactoylglutathione lyase
MRKGAITDRSRGQRVVGYGMRYLHTMIRVLDLPAAMRFFCDGLGMVEIRRSNYESGRFTLVYLGVPGQDTGDSPQVELTHNWDHKEAYSEGRNFGHLAYEVEDIYAACQRFVAIGCQICRPPRDGRMAFVRSPDNISVELLQRGAALAAAEPWLSAPNIGQW